MTPGTQEARWTPPAESSVVIPNECFDPEGRVECFRCDPTVKIRVASREANAVRFAYVDHAAEVTERNIIHRGLLPIGSQNPDGGVHSRLVLLAVPSEDGILHSWQWPIIAGG